MTTRKSPNFKHGQSRGKEYNAWHAMRLRCDDPANPNYGGRGIDYDPRWSFFQNFISDVGPAPDKTYVLDRFDNSKGYWPGNVRWTLPHKQALNRRIFHNNTSGVKQVTWDKNTNRWSARVYEHGERRVLYRGPDFFEAVCARKSWEVRHGI